MNPSEVRERLAFPRALLALLRDTELFGPLLDRAIEDLDEAVEALEDRVGRPG